MANLYLFHPFAIICGVPVLQHETRFRIVIIEFKHGWMVEHQNVALAIERSTAHNAAIVAEFAKGKVLPLRQQPKRMEDTRNSILVNSWKVGKSKVLLSTANGLQPVLLIPIWQGTAVAG